MLAFVILIYFRSQNRVLFIYQHRQPFASPLPDPRAQSAPVSVLYGQA